MYYVYYLQRYIDIKRDANYQQKQGYSPRVSINIQKGDDTDD
jgi:hypothetical protein